MSLLLLVLPPEYTLRYTEKWPPALTLLPRGFDWERLLYF